MVKICMKGYKPVELQWGGLSIRRGGHLTKAMQVMSKEVNHEGTIATFVLIRSREPWLSQAAMGYSYKHPHRCGDNASVLKDLREGVETMERRIREGLSPTQLEATTADPMDEMGCNDLTDCQIEPRIPKKKGRSFRCQVSHICMSEWPTEAMIERDTFIERKVCVYVEGTGKLWVHTNDLEWLVRSLWIIQQLKGVDDVASDDEGPDAPKRTDPFLTPEKCPRPQEDAGHFFL